MFPIEKDNPFDVFGKWLKEAEEANKGYKEISADDHTAMTLSTCSKDGIPSSRMVLLKKFDKTGFVFFTNLNSKKGQQLIENPRASLCFYWRLIGKQVRINGEVIAVSASEADEYFASRARQSQIGAWVSKQSQPLAGGNKTLLTEVAKKAAEFGMGKISRPPFWSGFRVIPSTIEFWQNGDFRMHKRLLYTRKDDIWEAIRLYP